MVMSAVDEISRSIPVHSIGPADYQNAADGGIFSQLRSSREFEEEQITFEIDNGWFDVDGSDRSASYQLTSHGLSLQLDESCSIGADQENDRHPEQQWCSQPERHSRRHRPFHDGGR